MSMTPSDIARLRELLAAATPGPWHVVGENILRVEARATKSPSKGMVPLLDNTHSDPWALTLEEDKANIHLTAFLRNHAEALLNDAEAGQRAHDEAIEKAAKAVEMIALGLQRHVHKATAEECVAWQIVREVRSLKLTSPSPGKETTT